MGETEIVIKASELSRMSIECPACGATLTIDGTRREWGAKRLQCGACGTLSDEAQNLLSVYREFYESIKKDKPVVTFRLRVPR